MAISFKQILIDSELVCPQEYTISLSTVTDLLTAMVTWGAGNTFGIDETYLTEEDTHSVLERALAWLEQIYGETEEQAKSHIIQWLMGLDPNKRVPGLLNLIGDYSGFPPVYAFGNSGNHLQLYVYTGDIFGDEIFLYSNLTTMASRAGYEGITSVEAFTALNVSEQWEIVEETFSDSGNFTVDTYPNAQVIENVTCETSICLFTSAVTDGLSWTVETPIFFPDGDKYICVLLGPSTFEPDASKITLYDRSHPDGVVVVDAIEFNTSQAGCTNLDVTIENTGNGLTLEELASVPQLQKYFDGVTPVPVGLSATKKHFIRVI